jgi:uncharacterized protein
MVAINVAQLLMAPQGTVRRYPFDEPLSGIDSSGEPRQVRGEVSLLRTGHGILADVKFETSLPVECARCLEDTRVRLSGEFHEEFVPTVDVRTGAPLPPDPDSEAFPIDANHILDLDEPLRQYILMNTPLQPLCREDCRGLCPECGQDLNAGTCACEPSLEGSPFAALKSLLDSDDKR